MILLVKNMFFLIFIKTKIFFFAIFLLCNSAVFCFSITT